MKKTTAALVFVIFLLGCRTLTGQLIPTVTPSPTVTATPTQTNTPPPRASATSTAVPAITASPSPTPAPIINLNPADFLVRIHPDDALYTGDLVSFEVIAPPDVEMGKQEVYVTLGDGAQIGTAGFGRFGIAGRSQATLQWAWDTSNYAAGEYDFIFEIVPNNTTFTRTVTLLPQSSLPYPEPAAAWATTESNCCLFYYVTGTEAARDIETLATIADAQTELAINKIGGELTEPIIVVLLPRVLGHGGFAGGEIYISYLDRNYAGNAYAQVFNHEVIHTLDRRAGGEFRPTMFVEGLAVYQSGGHFKPEPIVPRAASLFELGWYIPFDELTEEFYFVQHEVSYLQAAALITYMVETWGYDAFDTFYRSIAHPESTQADAIDQALQANFGISYAELEADYIAYLNAQPRDPAMLADIRLTVMFFDTVRRYQQALDPSAYFLTAWLLGINEMIENGNIVADYVRHPSAPENIALETLLVNADATLRAGEYALTEETLLAINAVLDARDAAPVGALARDIFAVSPLAADHYALVLATLDSGYTPQVIAVNGSGATVWATRGSAELVELNFVRVGDGWEIVDGE